MNLTEEQMAALEQLNPDMARQLREGREAHARYLAEAEEAGEWEKIIGLVDSQERAHVLLRALRAVDDDERARTLLADWFNVVDAFGDTTEDFRAQFERLGFVTDDEDGKMPDLPVTVYRAQWGSDPVPERALSWTARRDVAERFARYLTGPRAQFVLGIYREDDEPWIWEATAHEAYGWFIDRDEEEIIPKRLTGLRPISKLISVPKVTLEEEESEDD
jgi:hypothetical protein